MQFGQLNKSHILKGITLHLVSCVSSKLWTFRDKIEDTLSFTGDTILQFNI